jgi:hypothetical protein
MIAIRHWLCMSIPAEDVRTWNLELGFLVIATGTGYGCTEVRPYHK